MSDNHCYYLDANALIKFYLPKEQEKGIENIQHLVSSKTVFISNLTLLETLSFWMYSVRTATSKTRKIRIGEQLKDIFKRDIPQKFKRILLDKAVFDYAEELMFLYCKDFNLGTNDALHISTAKLMQEHPIMVTSDRVMKNICAQIQLATFDPEIEEII